MYYHISYKTIIQSSVQDLLKQNTFLSKPTTQMRSSILIYAEHFIHFYHQHHHQMQNCPRCVQSQSLKNISPTMSLSGTLAGPGALIPLTQHES